MTGVRFNMRADSPPLPEVIRSGTVAEGCTVDKVGWIEHRVPERGSEPAASCFVVLFGFRDAKRTGSAFPREAWERG